MEKGNKTRRCSSHPSLSACRLSNVQQPRTTQLVHRSQRRHFLPSIPWTTFTSSAGLVQSEEAAHGECILYETAINQCISSLRQLNRAATPRHPNIRSEGVFKTKIGQPVMAQKYSEVTTAGSPQEENVKKYKKTSSKGPGQMAIELVPDEGAFKFNGVMDEMGEDVVENMEQIAVICARGKYSLFKSYGVQLPPYGHGEPILPTVDMGTVSFTYRKAPVAYDKYPKPPELRLRDSRQPKYMAYGKLETIMSLSSDSGSTALKKKLKISIEEGLREKEVEGISRAQGEIHGSTISDPSIQNIAKRSRSKSTSSASVVFDGPNISKQDAAIQFISPTFLTSQPAQPHISTPTGLIVGPIFQDQKSEISPNSDLFTSPKSVRTRVELSTSTSRAELGARLSLLGSLAYLLPWLRDRCLDSTSSSHAETKLRGLLKSMNIDRKVTYFGHSSHKF